MVRPSQKKKQLTSRGFPAPIESIKPTSDKRAEPATPSFKRKFRVMVVDDHELVRDGLRQLIIRQPHLEVCGEAADEREAREHFRKLRPDLVIVDLTLQLGSGLDLIKWIRHERPPTKVIVSTMHDERDYGERALRAGAMGYASKHAPARTILTAINRVLEGRLYFSEALSERLMHPAIFQAAKCDDSPIAALSDREVEILCLLGSGMTTVQIAEQLHLSPNTIGTYRERLKGKLNLKRSAELSRFATLWMAEQR